MPVRLLALVIRRGARRAILLKTEMISAIVTGCSDAIILVRTPGSSLVARNAQIIAAAASSAAM